MITDLEQKVERLRGKRDVVQSRLKSLKRQRQTTDQELGEWQEAQALIQAVAQATQKELEFRVSELASLALDSVFPDPYKVVVDFSIRRGQTEADIWLERDGERIRPMQATGGGVVDVAAFALRVSSWSLKQPRPRPTFLLDEPFRFVSRDLQPTVGQLLKEVSNRLGIQFVIVSHETDLLSEAVDKVFRVRIKKGVSEVKEEEG